MFMRIAVRTQPLRWLIACLLSSLTLVTATAATTTRPPATTIICYVTPAGGSNPVAATSWATSTSNLQGAIDHVHSTGGGEVRVANGLYTPGSATVTSFSMANNVTIYGGFTIGQTSPGDRNLTGPSSTTLSGDLGEGAHSLHVIHNPESLSLNASAVLDGFVITGGDAIPNYNRGGGMYNDNASPTLRNCLFTQNKAEFAGAMINYNGSSPKLINCSFTDNFANNEGGAIYNENESSPTLTTCVFQNNTANASGGAIINYGVAPIITNCSFINNRAGNDGSGGGAVYNQESSPSLLNCLFINNTTSRIGGAMVNNAGSSPAITNCGFINNSADDQGGAITNLNNSSPTLLHCSFLNNSAGNGGGAILNNKSTLSIVNSVFFGNGEGIAIDGTGITASYSLFDAESVSGGQVTQTNCLTTTTSPFVSGTSIALREGSPAIDAGNPQSQTVAGAPYSATNLPATDLAGNPRIYGDRVDMGALEYKPACDPLQTTAISQLKADESGCPVNITGQATGSSFVFTGPNGYVFSTVYRLPGTYQVQGAVIKTPGVYTLQAVNLNACGGVAPVTMTVTVSKSCP